MEILRTEHLSKIYGDKEARVEALKDVSFSMEKTAVFLCGFW